MAAWQQELWRRQRAHLAAHEEDATTLFVRAPLTAVAQHHSHGAATSTTQAAKRLRSPRYNSGPASNKLRRSDQDDHISAATKNDNNKTKCEKKKTKKTKKNEKGKEKLHQVVVVDEAYDDVVDENETTTTSTTTTTTRSKKKRSASFKRAVGKIKHMTTSRQHDEGQEGAEAEETDEDSSALRPPQTQPHSLAATRGVFDLGANQVNALAWYQRLSAAARPQRAS